MLRIGPGAQAERLPDFVSANGGPSVLAGLLKNTQFLGTDAIVLRHDLDDRPQ